MLHEFINWLLTTVHSWGYAGIFILMALESTVLPIPSELVVIPAGYLAYQGKMNLALVILSATTGSLVGASINYAFALWVGRPFLERWGKYFFVRQPLLHKTDEFFARHGKISTFTGRLIPGIRHLISLPAGLAHMNPAAFAMYTILGAGIWASTLTLIGYFIGNNLSLINEYLHILIIGLVVAVIIIVTVYIWWQRSITKKNMS
ncbi:DedA family protein [Sulfuriferula nivalis]|uniref:Membrane protein n=1 Tax=Sulfuriferula nivalis TaxID=2675298 RepID=A0A809SHB9_9PROT|nr:DedA family protein [Sulfuriferula nivalis]BBP00670.1 membrane protein [Sulfuriferula nivalis]